MKLGELLEGLDVRRIDGDLNVEITGLSYDSRQTRPGHLYFSTARDTTRNRTNIDDALNRGARAVVVGGWDVGTARPAATLVVSERPRLLMGAAASRFFGAPSERVDLIGITGTSGKTTTSYIVASILEATGMPTGIIGTIGIFIGRKKIYSGLTTPESIDFESALAQMEHEGVRHAAAEVSSIGIAEGRVDALSFRACMFTNLGRDHLDYHARMEDYFAAKLRLFTEILPHSRRANTVAIVRGDDPFGRRVLKSVKGSKISFGMDRSLDAYPEKFDADLSGIRATLSVLGRKIEIESPLIGEINLLNILGAAALSAALGVDMDAVADGVRRCPGAPGRLEVVSTKAKPGVTVLVDYAHKPDALEAVLTALRRLRAGRIICVFGCGGDRDRGKRPIMGEIAGRLADIPVLTSDNPRSEDPMAIIAEVEKGLTATGRTRISSEKNFVDASIGGGYIVEPDRRTAIGIALRLAAVGDAVLIAGKGHEDYQLVAGRVLPFDDRVVVREIAAELGGGQS
ncbi:MAG TPA: UDP-N-acetylmuramoyl-L-alanyl-D-glutamate--2,6-diaminopimelate ligase [Candidatus Binatus sp.]|uniref:UDP-N-acetylmuramoyl-L-alanyl-D-glutamate--2, 6-diaminopimelate ligase n=1 Tax=Candidatus Binatus sp. TaxID=2811406 RepID=UPI002B45DCDF|nr:UDP-N-acetylmuramoyl-L-alanyl-D-glutamate--2,6-diaminopimelate ligase [Candidatus Binatus sp.]HKN14983.1 UDP-N-acetylmuramoyl-L-alanyl-D-glutamate--2,6-diaminopimelate ligase [Candidatus Binatus sp.]